MSEEATESEHLYRISHTESGSVAVVEFKFSNGKVKLDGVGFLRGNVFNLSAYRKAKAQIEFEAYNHY